jgi:hypothetical protein
MSEQKFSWYTKNSDTQGEFNSIEEAIEDAKSKYENHEYPFYFNKDGVIYVGPTEQFSIKSALRDIAEGIEAEIYCQLSDFSFGSNTEAEVVCSKEFYEDATNVLLPIVKKYIYFSPTWVCHGEEFNLINNNRIKNE